jgi:hypothetical protein
MLFNRPFNPCLFVPIPSMSPTATTASGTLKSR